MIVAPPAEPAEGFDSTELRSSYLPGIQSVLPPSEVEETNGWIIRDYGEPKNGPLTRAEDGKSEIPIAGSIEDDPL